MTEFLYVLFLFLWNHLYQYLYSQPYYSTMNILASGLIYKEAEKI